VKLLFRTLGLVVVLSPLSVSVARPDTGAVPLSNRELLPSQVKSAGCQTIEGSSFESAPRMECIENGSRFQRIVLNPKTILRKFDADWYDFRHPDALDPDKLKQLDTSLAPVWSSGESTVIRLDFSRVGKFSWSDNDDVFRAAVFWQALAKHYASLPDKERSARLVSFEVIRPAEALDSYRWTGVRATLAADIAEVAPRNTVWAVGADGRIAMASGALNSDVNLAQLQHGVNLGRYTGRSDGSDLEWPKDPANAPDSLANQRALANLSSKFDHVRLTITPGIFISETTHLFDFEGKAANLTKLDSVLTALWKAGRATIITIDGLDGAFFDGAGKLRLDSEPATFLKSLEGFWQKLSQHCTVLYDSLHLKANSSLLFFEVLNEPQEIDSYRWWGIQEEIINQGIRKGAKDSVIIAVGAGGGLDGLLSLVPLQEKNVVYSFHFYDPTEFTQQGADWAHEYMRHITGLRYPPDPGNANKTTAGLPTFEARERLDYLRYGWSQWGANYIAGEIDYVKKWADNQHVKVICDEFGVKRSYDANAANDPDSENKKNGADAASRIRWITDVRNSLRESRIPWTFWDYNSDTFGATLTKDGSDFDQNVMRALFPDLP
jgi:hypothetical protein